MYEEKIEQLLDKLNDKQKQAVRSLDGETLVIAGAGSGKTAVLTRRCVYLILQGIKPGSILSLTFTNKAAKEMNERMRSLLAEMDIFLPYTPPWSQDYSSSPLFCTFHSLGVRLLREFGECIGITKEFNILDSQDQVKILRDILKEMNVDIKLMTPGYVSYFISLCKQELLTPENSNQLSKDYLPTFHTAYRKYAHYCRENNVVDFDDLIFLTYLILKNHPEIRQICQERWQHIQVDEYQDINYSQFQLISLLYEKD
jgi:DNA helicase II / ATP-dependent DNA helicase PcrA